jgi:hypothetical protein
LIYSTRYEKDLLAPLVNNYEEFIPNINQVFLQNTRGVSISKDDKRGAKNRFFFGGVNNEQVRTMKHIMST